MRHGLCTRELETYSEKNKNKKIPGVNPGCVGFHPLSHISKWRFFVFVFLGF